MIVLMMTLCPIHCDSTTNNKYDYKYGYIGLRNGTDHIDKILSYVNGNAVYDG